MKLKVQPIARIGGIAVSIPNNGDLNNAPKTIINSIKAIIKTSMVDIINDSLKSSRPLFQIIGSPVNRTLAPIS